MKSPRPIHSSTEVVDAHSWRPASLQTLLEEIDHLCGSAAGGTDGRVVLFRGERDATWALNSTFARHVPASLGPKDQWYGNRIHQALLDKFSVAGMQPSSALWAMMAEQGIDPWFELMKRIQQHPDEFKTYPGVPGSNLLDWSHSAEVGLAFAAEDTEREGTLYVLDAVAAGDVLVIRPVREILDLMAHALVNGRVHGRPILFNPRRQLAYERAKRQQAHYVAQMDLRHPLDVAWRACEAERQDGEAIYWRLLLPQTVKVEANTHLEAGGRTLAWLLEPPA